MTADTSGKVALVTGSTAGIGRAVAVALAEAGASVVVNGRSEARLASTVGEMAAAGLRVSGAAADVTDPDAVRALFDQARDTFGPVDVLVNNAGAVAVADTEDMSLEEWNRVLVTNLTGPFLCSREAARQMLPRRSGVIVNISSIFGHGAMARRAAYCATKHGIEGLTQALALEWGDRGIRVVAVSPSYVLTERLAKMAEEGTIDVEPARRHSALGRLATPADVASAVVFLVGPGAAFMTGSTVLVDGGWMADAGW